MPTYAQRESEELALLKEQLEQEYGDIKAR